MRSIVAAHQKLTTTNCGQSLKLILLQLQEKLLKNLMSTILWSFSIWMKLEGWKSSVSGCLMSWLEIREKKNRRFWNVIFSYSMQQQWVISGSDCDVLQKVDFMWLLAMTSSVAGLRSSQALPEANCTKKGHRHCLVIPCPSDPLELPEYSETIISKK